MADFSLPNIFCKETINLDDADSEPSIFDLECDESTNASPTFKHKRIESELVESQFLLKLQKTLFKSTDGKEEHNIGMTTAYFGADSH